MKNLIKIDPISKQISAACRCFVIVIFLIFSTLMISGQSHGVEVDSMKIPGSFGLRIAYSIDNGIHVQSTQEIGVNVENAGNIGFRIHNALVHGVQVVNAGSSGMHVGKANLNGIQVDSADWVGMYVGSSGIHGFHVEHAVNNGFSVYKAGGDGVHVDSSGSMGLNVNKAASNGVHIDSAGWLGLYIRKAGINGVHVQSAVDDGFSVYDAGDDGVFVHKTGDHGFYVDSAGFHGFVVGNAVGDGVFVDIAGNDGLNVESAGDDGVYVKQAGNNGINVNLAYRGVAIGNSLHDGVSVDTAGENGVRVFYAGRSGVVVDKASTYGLYVDSAGQGVTVNHADAMGVAVDSAGSDGVFVYRAGGYSMNIQGNKNIQGGIDGHIAQIYNRADGGNADVLALKVGKTSNVGVNSNFITFYEGDDDPMGRVEGNGSGGVTYGTSGADYAEYLPVLDQSKSFQPGDLVGVYEGKISHNTLGATQVMVITDRAAVLGNMPRGETHKYQPVSFIGQIPVRVRGQVHAGDWIVAGGSHDGVGMAVTTADVTPGHQIIGRSWESSFDPGVKRVNTVVGLDHSQALMNMIHDQQQQIKQQEKINMDLQRQINELKELIRDLRTEQ